MSQRNEFPEHSEGAKAEGAKIDFLQNEINLCNRLLNLAFIERERLSRELLAPDEPLEDLENDDRLPKDTK